jgi:hypothetical protein
MFVYARLHNETESPVSIWDNDLIRIGGPYITLFLYDVRQRPFPETPDAHCSS